MRNGLHPVTVLSLVVPYPVSPHPVPTDPPASAIVVWCAMLHAIVQKLSAADKKKLKQQKRKEKAAKDKAVRAAGNCTSLLPTQLTRLLLCVFSFTRTPRLLLR